MLHCFRSIKGDLEQKTQARQRGIQRSARGVLLDQVQPIAPQIFGARRIRA